MIIDLTVCIIQYKSILPVLYYSKVICVSPFVANIIMQQEWAKETYAISMQYNTNKNDVMQNLVTESVIYKDS